MLDSKGTLGFGKWDNFYKIQKENNIPDLSLNIVNLHPESETGGHIPSPYDYDMTKDREKDIRFHDKTDYDIKLAQNISDYHDFAEQMTQLANNAIKAIEDQNNISGDLKKDLKIEFEQIMNTKQRTLTRVTNQRYFSDLIYSRFDICDVTKIQRKDDVHTISDKIFDFSSDTILTLIEEGERDALHEVVENELKKIEKEGVGQAEKEAKINEQLTKFAEDIKMETTKDDEYIIQCARNQLKERR